MQKEQNIEDSVDLWVRDSRAIGGEINEAVLRTIAQESEACRDWLSAMGVRFSSVLFEALGGLRPRCVAPRSGMGGKHYVRVMLAHARGLGIPVALSSEVCAIEFVASMRLWRVTVESAQGAYALYTRSLVLATGGFSANTAMRLLYDARFAADMATTANPEGSLWDGATGDGIRMAERAGAGILGMPNIVYLPYWGGRALDYVGAEIFINLEGRRFVNEAMNVTAIADAMMREPEQEMWVITDSRSVKGANFGSKFAAGRLRMSESIEEMARDMQIPASVLRETLERYNRFARQKSDPDFGKTLFTQTIDTPPYYWGREKLYVHCTLGGIAVDSRSRVLDASGRPIEGLYAAGETTGGIFGRDRLGGMSIAGAAVTGRIAGFEAARGRRA